MNEWPSMTTGTRSKLSSLREFYDSKSIDAMLYSIESACQMHKALFKKRHGQDMHEKAYTGFRISMYDKMISHNYSIVIDMARKERDNFTGMYGFAKPRKANLLRIVKGDFL